MLKRSRVIAVCWLLSSLAPIIARAQEYQSRMKELAVNLVAKLETSNQHSGTVLDFTDLQGSATELGRFLAQEMSDQLVAASKSITFVDRANLQYLMRENKLSTEGLVDPESSRKLGNLIGIDTIVFGTVTPIGERSIRLSVRAVAVETGRIVVAQSVTLLVTDDLASMFNHGISSAARPSDTSDSSSRGPDVRARFRAELD